VIININRADAKGQLAADAHSALARAVPGPEGRADAAVALLAMWTVSRDEADFIGRLDAALTITEDDVTEVTALVAQGEFHQAARWLLG
jgi:hypothetical protein